MTLGQLIEFLERQDPALVLPTGFASPHSYRGYYDDLAFKPAQDVTVAAMLASARGALGATFHGWKGGEFTMCEYTDCHLAMEGDTGEGIGPVLLRLMIAAGAQAARDLTAAQEPKPAPEAAAAVDALARVAEGHERVMWAALIDIRRGDPGAGRSLLLEQLDGWDGPDWDGTETGIEWLNRTREKS